MSQKNRGYITAEASIVLSLFLFFMLGMCSLYMVIMAEAHIHQSLASSVDYVAQYSYLRKKLLNQKEQSVDSEKLDVGVEQLIDSVLVKQKLCSYLGEDYYVDRVIAEGKNGIIITVEADPVNKKIMQVTARYFARINLPLLGTYSIPLSNQIKQKAFVGFSKEEYINDDYYVYVTPNREAYHMRRDCTHLMLDIKSVPAMYKDRYTPCYYCGSGLSGNKIFVTKKNEVYHSTKECVGLRRTVQRVKIQTLEGIGVCSRCGG